MTDQRVFVLTSSASRLLIRSDADSSVGIGHFMRMFALAQAWKDSGGEVLAVVCDALPALDERFVSEGISVERVAGPRGSLQEARATVRHASAWGADVIALDGSWFGSHYQRALSREWLLLVVDDEGACAPYHADVIVNQNLHARSEMYDERPEDSVLLLGTRYALLRREFRQIADGFRTSAQVRTILVTLGGSDPADMTSKVVRSVLPVVPEDATMLVVAGPANPHVEGLMELAASSFGQVEVATAVFSMAPLMRGADLAISSGGTTVWELAACGVPSVVGSIAPIEDRLLAGLTAEGLFAPVGRFTQLDPVRLQSQVRSLAESAADRRQMSAAATRLVDGCGCGRVIDVVRERMSRRREPSNT